MAGRTVIASYGNDDAARVAFERGVALVNRSHWGLIRVSGSTRLSFLHNLTTSDFNNIRPGECLDTVFLTATARLIDLVTACATDEAIWLIASPERRGTLLGWMPRFIFFNDDVTVEDRSDDHAIFSLLGPESGPTLETLGATLPEPGHYTMGEFAGVAGIRVLAGGGLTGEGYTLVLPADGAETLWRELRARGAEPVGSALWERLRIEQGRPAPDHEITEEYNPLEAGLWHAVSFDKGCYIGQEVVARLDTYQKLKQQLWGLEVAPDVQPGTVVRVDEKEVGRVTSVAGDRALAYIRTRAGGEGSEVRVGDHTTVVRELPFLSRARAER